MLNLREFLLITVSYRAMLRAMPPATLRHLSRSLAMAAHHLPINTGGTLQ